MRAVRGTKNEPTRTTASSQQQNNNHRKAQASCQVEGSIYHTAPQTDNPQNFYDWEQNETGLCSCPNTVLDFSFHNLV